jgi:hypothetical protein
MEIVLLDFMYYLTVAKKSTAFSIFVLFAILEVIINICINVVLGEESEGSETW